MDLWKCRVRTVWCACSSTLAPYLMLVLVPSRMATLHVDSEEASSKLRGSCRTDRQERRREKYDASKSQIDACMLHVMVCHVECIPFESRVVSDISTCVTWRCVPSLPMP